MFAARLLCLFLLVALLAPTQGLALDLCGCSGADHGLLCFEAESREPAPKGSCCAKAAEPVEFARTEAPVEGCPDCPALDVGSELVLTIPAEERAPRVQAVWVASALTPRVPAAPSANLTCFGGWPQPPPPKLRLHLLYQVLLS